MTQLPIPGDQPDPNPMHHPLRTLPVGHPATGSMFRHTLTNYNKMVGEINTMTKEEIEAQILLDDCPFRSELLRGFGGDVPTCPLCGSPIIAGDPHPREPAPPLTNGDTP